MAIMANGRVSPGSKYVDWDIKYHQRQTKHFHFFYLTEECVRASMHYLYIDWAVKPELQTNINTSVNQIMYQSFTPLPPPPPHMTPGIPYWKYMVIKSSALCMGTAQGSLPPLYNDKFLGVY